MKGNLNFITLIPARAGSKGLVNKNMKLLNGKPLINYTLTASEESKHVTKTFVSSDGDEILEYAKNYKKVLAIKRPLKLAQDSSLANEVIRHFIEISDFDEIKYIYMVYLQPTSPLRNASHLDGAIDSLINSNARSLISVKSSKEIPFKAMKLEDSLLRPIFSKEKLNENRQNLEETFYPNGAIYIFNLQDFVDNEYQIPMSNSLPFLMSAEDSIDIDTEADLMLASMILKH
jgi:CMP-N,N'-diacetyllegionaminic acid synthase